MSRSKKRRKLKGMFHNLAKSIEADNRARRIASEIKEATKGRDSSYRNASSSNWN